MRRIWNLFGDGKQPPQQGQQHPQPHGNHQDDGSSKDGDEDNNTVEMTNAATQTMSREDTREAMTPEAGTPVASTPVLRDERSVDEGGGKKKSKNKRKKLSRSREAKTPKKSSGSIAKRKRRKSKEEGEKEGGKVNRSKEHLRRDDEAPGGKHVVVAEAREIAAKEDNEEFENDGGGAMAKSKIKTRDLKWKEESSSEERKKKSPARRPKIVEARDVNKADDEEFENDGKGAMARSKIKTRDLKWKGSEESPTKTDEDRSGQKKPRKRVVAEAREVNKADDEEFENDGKGAMARSKIKTRDLKWKSSEHADASPGKAGSGSDSGGSEKKHPPKKPAKPKMVEARDVNKADDEEFENEGGAMARSKIKSRDLKWKEEEPKKPVIAEARELNKEDDEEFENGGEGAMAKSKIKTRDLKWKKDEKACTPTRGSADVTDRSEARSPAPRIVEARDVNKADDEEFENDGKSMARSKIKSRDLQWKKESVTPSKPSPSSTPEKIQVSVGRVQRTPERKEKSVMMSPPADSPETPPPSAAPRSIMQQLLPEKKKEQPEKTERSVISVMLPPPASPASPSPVQTTVRKEVKENVDKSGATRSRHAKNDETSRESSADKSFMRRLRSTSLNLSRKSKTRSDKSAARELAKQQKEHEKHEREKEKEREKHEKEREKHEKEREKKEEKEKSDSSSQISQPSPDKSSKERTSLRLDVVASAADKSMKSIKSIFKKTDDTKKRPEELLPHVERDANDVQVARRLMEMLKRNNVFENALFPYQNESLRAHFTSGSRRLDQKTMDLLFKAADFVLDKILYRGEELDEYIDSPLKTFILNRTKSRTMVVELLLKNAEFLPQTWGGRTVVLMRSEEEVTVAPEDEKSKKESRSSKKEDDKK